MKASLLRRRDAMQPLIVALLSETAPVLAQSPSPPQSLQSESEKFQARIDAAAVALGSHSRYRGLSPKYRLGLAEFVAGNMLFVLLHEIAHAAIGEMRLPVLGKQEDAADSYAAVRLITIGSAFTHRVLAEAARGWFLSDRRDQKTGDKINYYDEHGLDQQRAYQIVCLMVRSDPEKFRDLANETKLPPDRQQSCARDYGDASYAWDLVLKPHLRAPDLPRTKIDISYGEPRGRVALAGEALRSIESLETVAQATGDRLTWPSAIELELQTCGSADAYWTQKTRKVRLCYELAVDFADLYRAYGTEPAIERRRTTARGRHVNSSALR